MSRPKGARSFAAISNLKRNMSIIEFEILNDKKFDESWSTFLDSDVFRGSEVNSKFSKFSSTYSNNFYIVFI